MREAEIFANLFGDLYQLLVGEYEGRVVIY
jgi:hypothetical protein